MPVKVYSDFKSEEQCVMSCKDFYTDRQGFLNDNAFHRFVEELKANADIPELYLVCLNIDLRKSNAESTAKGDYELRKFVVALEDYYIFRIQGEKFNMLVTKEQIPTVEAFLNKPSDKYAIYYGIVKDKPFKPQTPVEERELIHKGVSMMFANKGEIKQGYNADNVMGGKGNTPRELQETATRKYRSTMWYSEIHITITDPFYKEVTVYAFPTEVKQAMQSIPTIVAVYDNVSYNVKFDSQVKFGVNGIKFNLNCRFDRDEHLAVTVFTQDKCKYDIKTKTVEGVCIPVTFGKRITPTKQIFPIRPNITGMCDYVALEDGAITLNTEGIVISPSGTKYGVVMDERCIELVKM